MAETLDWNSRIALAPIIADPMPVTGLSTISVLLLPASRFPVLLIEPRLMVSVPPVDSSVPLLAMLMAALSMAVVPVELKTPLTLMTPLVIVVTPLTVTIAPGSRLSVPLVLVNQQRSS